MMQYGIVLRSTYNMSTLSLFTVFNYFTVSHIDQPLSTDLICPHLALGIDLYTFLVIKYTFNTGMSSMINTDRPSDSFEITPLEC